MTITGYISLALFLFSVYLAVKLILKGDKLK